jgi:hypothetical protein
MNRYFKLYRDSMKRLPKMETILEEVYEKEHGPRSKVESSWKMVWYTSRESDWDQWVDIEYMDEPSIAPPEFKVTTARQ